ncbi:MAG: hypothetical protein F6K41_15660 [Symploca sp. SIO3E6]|nr:hypothetical protein [Caldora sp. SIO3E6]
MAEGKKEGCKVEGYDKCLAGHDIRHQVIMGEGINYVRYRIWPQGKTEANRWLCEDNNTHLDPKLPE